MEMVPGSVEDELVSTRSSTSKTPAQQTTCAAPDMLHTGVRAQHSAWSPYHTSGSG